mgnify:FL=1
MSQTIFIEETNFDAARRKIKQFQKEKIVFSSPDDTIARKVLEKEKINILLIKQKNRKDKLKQRDSGLDSVMIKIAKKNDVEIGIFLDEITEASGKEKAEILGRIKQNIKLCSKNKVKMKFLFLEEEHHRNDYDLRSLGLILGMPTWMTSSL